MCGIAVAIDWDGAKAAVQRLIEGMLHRGDVTDPLVTIGDKVAMCTRRLRIVDAAHGMQPQASFDERFLVSLNGEIYNHVDLRRELEALGVAFSHRMRHRSRRERAPGLGPVRDQTPGRHVCLRRGRYGDRRVSCRARSFRSEAALSDTIARRLSVLLGNQAAAGCDRRRRSSFVAPGLYADPQLLRTPLRAAVANDVERLVASGTGSDPVRSCAHSSAVEPSGRGAIQRRHRQHARRALCAAPSPDHARLYRRWTRRARSNLCQALCRRDRSRSARGER